MLTARDAAPDIVNGLDVGADDYLTKPFLPKFCWPVVVGSFQTNYSFSRYLTLSTVSSDGYGKRSGGKSKYSLPLELPSR